MFNCPVKKHRYETRAEAEAGIKAQSLKFPLYVYRCGHGDQHYHLTKRKQEQRTVEPTMTNAERKHLANRLADVGRQLANEENRYNRQELQRLGTLVEKDREWLRQQAALAEIAADRMADYADSLRHAQRLAEEFGKCTEEAK
jgi:hypothetical protein